jgi:hypothetical protein
MIMNNIPINKIMYLSLHGTLDIEFHVGETNILIVFWAYMNKLQVFNKEKYELKIILPLGLNVQINGIRSKDELLIKILI